jgi:hypothetical protein
MPTAGNALLDSATGRLYQPQWPATMGQVKQTEIDFGSMPVNTATFVVADADVTAASKLIGAVAYVAPTGKSLDELEFDVLDLRFAPGAGIFTLLARSLQGYVAGKFKINYAASAA